MSGLAVRAARGFDGESETLLEDVTVLVGDGGRISAIHSGLSTPDGYAEADLGDVTLLPGLVDAHQHLCFDGSTDPLARLAERDDDQMLESMRAAARTALAAGITTVRDLGDRGYLAVRLRDELAGDRSAPRILAAGPPITTTAGHCWFLGGEADGVDGVRAAVRAHADRGVDVIKVMASGGELTTTTRSHESQYGRAELEAIVDEARRAGLPVAAHAHATQAIADAMTAGVDSIEHCSFFTEEGIDDRPDLVEALAASGVTVSLTVGIRPGATPPPRIAARQAALYALVGRLYRAGAPLVASTDAGIGPPKPHDVLPYAVGQLVRQAGLSTVDALRAATSRPARLCRINAGRLAPGLDADLLAVGGDPLRDPAALLDVRAVYRRGQRVR